MLRSMKAKLAGKKAAASPAKDGAADGASATPAASSGGSGGSASSSGASGSTHGAAAGGAGGAAAGGKGGAGAAGAAAAGAAGAAGGGGGGFGGGGARSSGASGGAARPGLAGAQAAAAAAAVHHQATSAGGLAATGGGAAPASFAGQAPPAGAHSAAAAAASAFPPGPPPVGANGKPALPDVDDEAAMRRAYAEPLPSFRDVPPGEKQLLFVRKLHLCAFSFDFGDPGRDAREKEAKRQTLLELVDYAHGSPGRFSEAVSEDIAFMLARNLFRALPPSRHDVLAAGGGGADGGGGGNDADEEEPALEPAWPHLQIVYEFLLRYVVSNDTDAKVAKRHVDQGFVLRLLDLFDSEDPRERDYLKVRGNTRASRDRDGEQFLSLSAGRRAPYSPPHHDAN